MVSTLLIRNGLNELTGSLPVPETWTSQGTELELCAGKAMVEFVLGSLDGTSHLLVE